MDRGAWQATEEPKFSGHISVNSCWPETNWMPDFLQEKKKCVCGIRKKCNLKPTAVMNHVQLLSRQRKENIFKEGRRELAGEPLKNKESMAFHFPIPCQKRRGIFLLPIRLCYVSGRMCYFLWPPNSIKLTFYLLLCAFYWRHYVHNGSLMLE